MNFPVIYIGGSAHTRAHDEVLKSITERNYIVATKPDEQILLPCLLSSFVISKIPDNSHLEQIIPRRMNRAKLYLELVGPDFDDLEELAIAMRIAQEYHLPSRIYVHHAQTARVAQYLPTRADLDQILITGEQFPLEVGLKFAQFLYTDEFRNLLK